MRQLAWTDDHHLWSVLADEGLTFYESDSGTPLVQVTEPRRQLPALQASPPSHARQREGTERASRWLVLVLTIW